MVQVDYSKVEKFICFRVKKMSKNDQIILFKNENIMFLFNIFT
jgi:hypothetical protein